MTAIYGESRKAKLGKTCTNVTQGLWGGGVGPERSYSRLSQTDSGRSRLVMCVTQLQSPKRAGFSARYTIVLFPITGGLGNGQ